MFFHERQKIPARAKNFIRIGTICTVCLHERLNATTTLMGYCCQSVVTNKKKGRGSLRIKAHYFIDKVLYQIAQRDIVFLTKQETNTDSFFVGVFVCSIFRWLHSHFLASALNLCIDVLLNSFEFLGKKIKIERNYRTHSPFYLFF